jgi:hypothetical protein
MTPSEKWMSGARGRAPWSQIGNVTKIRCLRVEGFANGGWDEIDISSLTKAA